MFCEALCSIILKSINNNNNNQVIIIIIIMSHPDSSLSKSIKTHVLFLVLECDAYCYFIGTTQNTNETKARTKAASSSRSVYLCYLLFPNCVDWKKILCTFWAGQHSKRDKKKNNNIHPQIYSDRRQCQHLKSTCSHLLHVEDKIAPVSCQKVPCISHSST